MSNQAVINLINSLRQIIIEQGPFTEESDYTASAKNLFKMADISRSLIKEEKFEPTINEVIKNEYIEPTV